MLSYTPSGWFSSDLKAEQHQFQYCSQTYLRSFIHALCRRKTADPMPPSKATAKPFYPSNSNLQNEETIWKLIDNVDKNTVTGDFLLIYCSSTTSDSGAISEANEARKWLKGEDNLSTRPRNNRIFEMNLILNCASTSFFTGYYLHCPPILIWRENYKSTTVFPFCIPKEIVCHWVPHLNHNLMHAPSRMTRRKRRSSAEECLSD